MSEKKVGLFLDDERWPKDVADCTNRPEFIWVRAKTLTDFRYRLETAERHCGEGKFYNHVAFDWHLAGGERGSEALAMLIKYCEDEKLPMPVCSFHSSDKQEANKMRETYEMWCLRNKQRPYSIASP